MSVRSALRILLVDDHPVVRRGVADILIESFAGATVRQVACGADAIRLTGTGRWDLVILDLTLPDGSGLDVLKRIREIQPRTPVLILSVHAADQFEKRTIAAGASGYLTKQAADVELVTAVNRLVRGGRYFSPEVLAQMAVRTFSASDRPHERLSDREYEVLRQIGSGRTVSEIARSLTLSVKTVSTYRSRLMEKMAMRTNAELTRYAVSHRLADDE
jgi:DNA-binding NarL/FixJ family response regulator